MLNLNLMTKKDKKEYKKLLSIQKFLNKKINKMQKTVELYNKTLELKDLHLHNAITQIEDKYIRGL